KGKKGPPPKPKPVLPPPPPPVPAVTAPQDKAALNAAFDSIMTDLLKSSPLTATYLGLDKGEFAYLKGKIDDRSTSGLNSNFARLKKAVATLQSINRNALSSSDRIDYDAMLWDY